MERVNRRRNIDLRREMRIRKRERERKRGTVSKPSHDDSMGFYKQTQLVS